MCLCICEPHMFSACEGQNCMSNGIGLEFQKFVSHLVGIENQTHVFRREVGTLN